MKMIAVVALALVAAAAALPVDKEEVKLTMYENEQSDQGYKFGYETSDGVQRSEEGVLKEVLDEENKPHTVVAVRGVYVTLDSEGHPVKVSYVADELGYRAEGDSIPKAPVEEVVV